MHLVIVALCALVLVLLVWVSVLRRRDRARDARVARLEAAAVVARTESAELAEKVKALQGSAVAVALRFCPRVHAAQLPAGWVGPPGRRAGIDDEYDSVMK